MNDPALEIQKVLFGCEAQLHIRKAPLKKMVGFGHENENSPEPKHQGLLFLKGT